MSVGIGNGNVVAHHRQGDSSDNGSKTNHSTHMNNVNNKKILNIQDHHSRYNDNSKKLGSTPKLCQNGLLSNNNGTGGNTKSENHPYNNNRAPQGNVTLYY